MAIQSSSSHGVALAGRRRRGFLHPEALSWILLGVLLLLTAGAWHLAREAATHRAGERFHYRAERERDHL